MLIGVLQLEHLIDHKISHDSQHHQVHNPNLTFNHQVITPIHQLGPVVSDGSLLALVLVEQPIIQAAITSVETVNDTKCKFESLIGSVENAAQILKQDVLCIAFSKMIGSPDTSVHELRDHVPYVMWKDLKSEPLRQYSTTPFECHATPSFGPSTARP